MQHHLAALVSIVLLTTSVLAYVRYDGYKVFEVMPETVDQVHTLHKLSSVLGFELDFWKDTGRVGRSAVIMVAPQHESKLLTALKQVGFKPKVVVDDVGVLVGREMEEMQAASKIPAFGPKDDTDITLNQYHTFADMMTYLRAVQAKYSSFVSLGSLGNSVENRDILYIKIGTPKPGQQKNALWIDAGIHAREWIAPATAIWTIDTLVRNYTTTYKNLLDAIDIYVAPCLNPDGYEFSRTNTRLWRKNRRPPTGGCAGVDLNRNYGFHWGESGTSNSPCSDVYLGPSPNSEPETVNLKRFLDANATTIKAYLTLHSYSQDILYPWGYAVNTYPPDVAELRALGQQAGAAITQVHGTRYTVGGSADSLYPAAGASDDYAKSVGIKFVYTIELRPVNDPPGFVLPAAQIVPTGEETWAGMYVVAQKVMTM